MSKIHSIRSFILVVAAMCVFASVTMTAYATTLQEEIDLGRKLDAQIIKEMPLSKDLAAQKEIEELGQQLAKHVKRNQITYHFAILDDDKELNAFSIPGGYVYFSQRMWDTLRKDERIGVLAHEIAHVDQRHGIDAMSKAQSRSIGLGILLTIFNANRALTDVAGIAHQLYTLKYSRSDEQEADIIAVDLSKKANMNPAGILLAMRKINRFQDESGGQPPKILSTHPPTKERVEYIAKYLADMGIEVPSENVQTEAVSYQIGTITSVSDNSVVFTSSQPLKPGDVVWLMTTGWDYTYEKKTMVPAARGIVKSGDGTYTADIWRLPSAQKNSIVKGSGVFAPPAPAPEQGIGTIGSPLTKQNAVPNITTNVKLNKFDRLLAMQTVWDHQTNSLINDAVGYVVITNPANAAGYVTLTRPQYSYAPASTGAVLVKLKDPDEGRWIGPIISIGRNGQTIEVLTDRTLDAGKTYDVLYPAWDSKDTYKARIAGQARFRSANGKIVLQMTSYSPGWNISTIQNGFEVYEAQ